MSRSNRGSKAPGYDYWSRRPFSTSYGYGPEIKNLCHRAERRQSNAIVQAELEELEERKDLKMTQSTAELVASLSVEDLKNTIRDTYENNGFEHSIQNFLATLDGMKIDKDLVDLLKKKFNQSFLMTIFENVEERPSKFIYLSWREIGPSTIIKEMAIGLAKKRTIDPKIIEENNRHLFEETKFRNGFRDWVIQDDEILQELLDAAIQFHKAKETIKGILGEHRSVTHSIHVVRNELKDLLFLNP